MLALVIAALLAASWLLDQELVQLEPADLAVRERLALPADVEFTALVITRSGVPHLLGDRAGAPVLVTLRDGALSAPIELRPAVGRDWSVSGAALSSDDRRLAVMYHGRNSTGADVVDLASGTREPCPRAVRSGCLSIVHGTAAFAGDGRARRVDREPGARLRPDAPDGLR